MTYVIPEFAVMILLSSYTLLVFCIGYRFGSSRARLELDQGVKENLCSVLKQRDELSTNLEIAKSRIERAGLDVKKFFPWLALLVSCGVASCGGNLCFAQAAPAVGTYYSPDTNLETLDVAALGTARHSIDLAAFSLTDQAIIAKLADRASHGVAVRIYLDRGELQSECRGDATCARSPIHALIGLPGVEIRVKYSKVLMHLKSYVVDAAIERDGSANFSEQGEYRQDNSAIFTTAQSAVVGFEQKFQAMWSRKDNLSVAQAVAVSPTPQGSPGP
jgi:hypothetical protein